MPSGLVSRPLLLCLVTAPTCLDCCCGEYLKDGENISLIMAFISDILVAGYVYLDEDSFSRLKIV